MGNVSFYSVGKDMRKTHRIPVVNASCELAKLRATHEMSLTLESFELPTSALHVAYWTCSSREPVVSQSRNPLSSQFFTKLNIIPITFNPTKITGK